MHEDFGLVRDKCVAAQESKQLEGVQQVAASEGDVWNLLHLAKLGALSTMFSLAGF
jgi:hypothetical protein